MHMDLEEWVDEPSGAALALSGAVDTTLGTGSGQLLPIGLKYYRSGSGGQDLYVTPAPSGTVDRTLEDLEGPVS